MGAKFKERVSSVLALALVTRGMLNLSMLAGHHVKTQQEVASTETKQLEIKIQLAEYDALMNCYRRCARSWGFTH